jgi:prolyl-tRNA synthetase
VVIGRGWANGVLELRDRFSGETRELPVDSAVSDIAAAVS